MLTIQGPENTEAGVRYFTWRTPDADGVRDYVNRSPVLCGVIDRDQGFRYTASTPTGRVIGEYSRLSIALEAIDYYTEA